MSDKYFFFPAAIKLHTTKHTKMDQATDETCTKREKLKQITENGSQQGEDVNNKWRNNRKNKPPSHKVAIEMKGVEKMTTNLHD